MRACWLTMFAAFKARTRHARKQTRLHPELLESRALPAFLTQVAAVDGYASDTNQDGVFESVNPAGTSVQATLINGTSQATDQANTPAGYQAYNTSAGSNLAIGQEFRPAYSSVGFVDLLLSDAGSDTGPGASFQVRIRSGSITGTVLGTSSTTFVADNTNLGGGSTYTRFNFTTPVSVTPSSTYVIEAVQLGPISGGNANFSWVGDNPNGSNLYASGRAIIHSTPVTNNFDFNFREGTAAQPGLTENGVMEFSTGPLNVTSAINSVTLFGTANLVQDGGAAAPVSIGFYAYAGNGQLSTADATASSTRLALVTKPALGAFSVNLDPAQIQSIIRSAGYSGYLGVLVKIEYPGRFYLSSNESSATGIKPTLQIGYDGASQPTAANDAYAMAPGTTQLSVAAPGVLGNDTHAVGAGFTASLVSPTTQGTINLAADGSFVYTLGPAALSGTDTFIYKAVQGNVDSNLATVSIRPNRPPVGYSRSYVTTVNTTLTTTVSNGVLANDYDPDNDPLTALLTSGPSHGTLTLNSNGSFTYVPNAGYTGSDQFIVQASDGFSLSNLETIDLFVDTIAVPQNDSYSVNQDTVLTVAAPGVLGNDSDANNEPLMATRVTSPTHGTLSLSSNGSFSYTPAAGYYGPDSFTYKAWDGHLYSSPATVSLTVNHVNHAPVAGNNTYTTSEDTPLAVTAPGVLGNDTDSDGDPLSAVLVAGPSHGSLTLDSGGSFTYTPAPDYNGSDSFTYRASDATLTSGVATVALTITSVNDPPVANDDSYSTNEDTMLTVAYPGPLANDTDVDTIALNALLVSGPAHGTLTLDNSGAFSYTPAPNYNGSDSFTYQANDGPSYSNLATVTLTIAPVNDAPAAGNDAYALSEDGTLTVAAPGTLGNDSDADGDSLTATLVAGPGHGTLIFNSDGSFSYAPAADYNGGDSFTYFAGDSSLSSNVATVSLTIGAVNDAPAAADDAFTTNEDTPLTIAAPGILANDGDADGDVLTAVLVTGPSHGTLALNGAGSLSYTPAANYNGSDSFTYLVNDGLADSSPATVSLTIAAVNDAPAAAGDPFTLSEDSTLTVSAPGVLGNDSDVDSSALTAVLAAGPAHGNLILNGDGSFSYTPVANYNGNDGFTYVASDGSADSSPATVSLTITAVNDAPAAVDDAFATSEDTSLTVAAPGVLGNDGDLDGDVVTATLVTGPSHGLLTFNSDGSFSYAAAANYNGSDSFTYRASDGALDSAVTTVALTIAAVNDAPVAANDAFSASEDTPLSVASPGVLGNDSDVDGGALSAVLVSGPAHGTLTLDAAGSFSYVPALNYNGSDSFTYTVSDGALTSSTASVALVVNAVNDAPVADAGPDRSGSEGTALSFDGRASTDIDGDALSYAWSFGDGGSGSGATPSHVFADNGTYAVTLTVSDGHGGSASDTLLVTVTNVAPTATLSGPATGVRGQARGFVLGATDPSSVDQSLSFTFAVAWGDGATQTVVGQIGQQAEHVYTATGTYTVSLTATDKDGGVSLVAQQSIVIKAVELQGTTLVVGGTTQADNIVIQRIDAAGNINVTIGNAKQGTFAAPAQLVVYAQAGNDTLQLSSKKIQGTTYYVSMPAILFGDAGGDSIDASGSSASNVLVGGAGTDTLQGGSGRDIVIGGLDADSLKGGGDDDILIAGSTDFDANLTALLALLAEWGRTDASYPTRVGHLNGTLPGGVNGSSLLNITTVDDDAAIDHLYGQAGTDWFFVLNSGSKKDNINDAGAGESITTL